MASLKASLALLLVAFTASATAANVPQLTADVLNFALNLECLEAQFYSCAYYGEPLSDELNGGGPMPVGCKQANLTGVYKDIAKSIADDEIAHVAFLRSVLGGGAVACPKVDIGPAFAAAANAAFNTTLSPPFDPYANDLFFLHGAFIFEDVGVTAYKGAVPVLLTTMGKGYTPDSLFSTVMESAAGILGTEAYHAGSIRTSLLEQANTATPYNVTVTQIIQAISDLRDVLDGASSDLDQGLYRNQTKILVPADASAIPFSRSTGQVLQIVYGGTKPGLFFPDGLNGNIK